MKASFLKCPLSCKAGTLVIAFYCIFTFTSYALFPPPVSPIDNWLSDLGNSSFNPNGAILYNLGCILTGLALFPFFIGMYKWYRDDFWHRILLVITQCIGCCAAFSLIMIGVFSEDFIEQHRFWSAIFFRLNLFVLILSSISLFLHPDFMKLIGIYGILVAIINLIFVSIIITPLLEWFTVFTALGFVGLLVYNMYKVFI